MLYRFNLALNRDTSEQDFYSLIYRVHYYVTYIIYVVCNISKFAWCSFGVSNMASETGAGKRKLLQESHEAAHILIGKFTSGTLRAAAGSFLRQLVRRELKSSQGVKSVQIERSDLDEVYEATSTLGYDWADQIMSPFDEDISLVGSGEYFIAQEYARIIRATVARAGFLENTRDEGISTDLGAGVTAEPSSDEDDSESEVEEYNTSEQIDMDRKIHDPCSLRVNTRNQGRSITTTSSSSLSKTNKRRRSLNYDDDKSSTSDESSSTDKDDVWLPTHPLSATTNGIHLPIAKVLSNDSNSSKPVGYGVLGKPAPFMSTPSNEENDEIIKYKIYKLDKRASTGTTHWYGGGWDTICEAASYLSDRNKKSLGDKQEYEIVPKRLAEAENASRPEHSGDIGALADVGNSDGEIPAWKESMYGKQVLSLLKAKKRKLALEKNQEDIEQEPEVEEETRADELLGRKPSNLHEEIWTWEEIQEEISRSHGRKLLEDVVHESGEVCSEHLDRIINMFQGAVKRLGDVHLWEQGINGPLEKTRGVLKRTWRERMGEGKRERGKNGINPYEIRFSNIVKSESKCDDFFEIDLGSCLLEIVGKDSVKKLHAFRSIEVTLFDSVKDS